MYDLIYIQVKVRKSLPPQCKQRYVIYEIQNWRSRNLWT